MVYNCCFLLNATAIAFRGTVLETVLKKIMKKGDTVHWEWGKGEGQGKVVQKHEKTVSKKIKGTTVKRKASKEEPAYTVEQKDGDTVLKSESELKEGKKEK